MVNKEEKELKREKRRKEREKRYRYLKNSLIKVLDKNPRLNK
jgi:hypothetical protein